MTDFSKEREMLESIFKASDDYTRSEVNDIYKYLTLLESSIHLNDEKLERTKANCLEKIKRMSHEYELVENERAKKICVEYPHLLPHINEYATYSVNNLTVTIDCNGKFIDGDYRLYLEMYNGLFKKPVKYNKAKIAILLCIAAPLLIITVFTIIKTVNNVIINPISSYSQWWYNDYNERKPMWK